MWVLSSLVAELIRSVLVLVISIYLAGALIDMPYIFGFVMCFVTVCSLLQLHSSGIDSSLCAYRVY